MRVGFGYDSHRFGDEPHAVQKLGGVAVENCPKLVAHSDGDAVIHAVVDALLGAAALGNVGEHFPDSDPRWKGADSAALLEQVVAELAANGWRVVNVDVAIVCEKPKIAPYAAAMSARLAEILRVDAGDVSVKGKTNEKMDAVGAGLGIEVHCVALIDR